MVFFADALTLDAPRRTKDGYLAVRARAARTGVYQYTGREVDPDNAHGLRDHAVVNVLRDERAVFDEKAVRSFIGKPITNDHPREPVTAKNWKKYADGVIMGAMRDGDHLAFDLLLMDEGAIADTDAGKVQLSNGYGAALEFGDFVAPDGTKCQARQDAIDGNHVARVDQGRAGKTCAIPTAALCDALPSNLLDNLKTEKPVKTMLIDGLTVDVSNADTAIATINTILAARDAANGKVTGLEAKVAEHVTNLAAKDAEIATLKQAVTDAKVSPADLRAAGKAFEKLVTDAKRVVPTLAITDAMDEAAIRKATVTAKLGDKATEGWTDAQFETSFVTNVALLGDAGGKDVLRDAISGQPVQMGDAATEFRTAQDKRKAAMRDAYKSPFNAADAA